MCSLQLLHSYLRQKKKKSSWKWSQTATGAILVPLIRVAPCWRNALWSTWTSVVMTKMSLPSPYTPLHTSSNSKTDTVASLTPFIRRPWTSGRGAEWISVCVRVFALEFWQERILLECQRLQVSQRNGDSHERLECKDIKMLTSVCKC